MAKNLLLWMIIAAVLLTVFNNFNQPITAEELVYSDFIQEVQRGNITEVTITGGEIHGIKANGTRFVTVNAYIDDPKLFDDLVSHDVRVSADMPEQQSIWTQLLVASFPILIIIAVFMFFMRQMQGGGVGGKGGPMAFGKSKAKMRSQHYPNKRARARQDLKPWLL